MIQNPTFLDPRCPRCAILLAAQGIEAASAAETVQLGSVHESPVGSADAPRTPSLPLIGDPQ